MDNSSSRKYRRLVIFGNSRRSFYWGDSANTLENDGRSSWARRWNVIFHYRNLSGILEKCYAAVGQPASLQLLGNWTAGSTADKVDCRKKNRNSLSAICAAGGNMDSYAVGGMLSIFRIPSDDMAGDTKRRIPIHYYTRRKT